MRVVSDWHLIVLFICFANFSNLSIPGSHASALGDPSMKPANTPRQDPNPPPVSAGPPSSESELTILRTELGKMILKFSELEKLQKQSEQLKAELDELKKPGGKLETLQLVNSNQRNQLAEFAQTRQRLEESESRIKTLEISLQQLRETEASMTALKGENERLSRQLAETRGLEQRMEALASEKRDLESKLQAYAQAQAELLQLREDNRVLSLRVTETDQLRQQVEQLHLERQQLAAQVDAAKSKVDSVESASREISVLREKLQMMDSLAFRLKDLESENRIQRAKLEEGKRRTEQLARVDEEDQSPRRDGEQQERLDEQLRDLQEENVRLREKNRLWEEGRAGLSNAQPVAAGAQAADPGLESSTDVEYVEPSESSVYWISSFNTEESPETSKGGVEAGFHRALVAGDVAKAAAILDSYPQLLNARDSVLGWTPLHWAVDRGHEALADFLLRKGAPVNALDKRGWTPLRLAQQYERQNLVQLLMSFGGV